MGDGKPAWLCGDCEGKDNKPFSNHGFRSSCHLCGLPKNKCILGSRKSPKSPTTSSLTAADKRIKQLEAQVAAGKEVATKNATRHRAELAAAKKADATLVEDVEDLDEGYSLDDLFKQKACFAASGKKGEEDVARISALIRAKQGQVLASKPASVQLRQVELRVTRAKAAAISNEEKLAAAHVALLAQQEKVAELADADLQGKKEVVEAEAARAMVVQALHEVPASPAPASAAAYDAIHATLPDDFYMSAGFTREHAQILLAKLARGHEIIAEDQKAKDAAAAAATKLSAAAASAKIAAEAADATKKEELAAATAAPVVVASPPDPPGTFNGALVLNDELMEKLREGLTATARKKLDGVLEDSKQKRLKVAADGA
jgi:hypothetical protein